MVARRPDRVNRALSALIVALSCALVAQTAWAKRRPKGEEFTETGVVGEDDEEGVPVTPEGDQAFVLGDEELRACRQDLFQGHLGFGTAADLFARAPSGVHVNLLDGNLVWQGSFLPHGNPVNRLGLTLTYNSQAEPTRRGELPSGWTHSFSSWVRPGAWGVMEVVEHDGFVHRYYMLAEGRPLTREGLVDAILTSRRSGGGADGAPIPSGPRFRRLLEGDDAFLDAMRARFLGGGVGLAGTYVSQARGHQILQVELDGSAVRARASGGVERYDRDGRLLSIEPAVGPPVILDRTSGELDGAEIPAGPDLILERDGGGDLVAMRGEAGRRVRLEYERGRLAAIEAPQGTWSFTYDDAGALTAVNGPEGRVGVRYLDGRVAALDTPTGTTNFAYTVAADRIQTEARGPGGDVDVDLDLEAYTRRVDGPRGPMAVTFDAGFNRPLRAGDVTLAYDDRGHITAVGGPRGTLTVEQDALGDPTAVVDAADQRVLLSLDTDGRLNRVADAVGVVQEYRYDDLGLLLHERAGSSALRVKRSPWGQVQQVAEAGGDTAYLHWDGAGRPVSYSTGAGAMMRAEWDGGDRLVRLSSADHHELTLVQGDGLRIADVRGRVLSFSRGAAGWLDAVESTSPGRRVTLAHGANGLLIRAVDPGGATLTVSHEAGRVAQLDGRVLGPVRFVHADGRLASAQVGPAAWAFPGGVTGPDRITSSGGRDVGLVRDPAGRLTGITHGGLLPFASDLDDAGRPRAVDPATGSPISIQRDLTGHVTHVGDGDDPLLWMIRDGRGRVISAGRGDEPWQLNQGLRGWPGTLTSPAGDEWTLEVDTAGYAVRLAGPAAPPVQLSWTADGSLLEARSGVEWLSIARDGGGVITRVATHERALDYRWSGGRVDIDRSGRPRRAVLLDGQGRIAGTRGAGDIDVGWGQAGQLLTLAARGEESPSPSDALGRPRLRPRAGDETLELDYGADGLISRCGPVGTLTSVARDARGHAQGEGESTGTGCDGDAASRDAVAHALLAPYLPLYGGPPALTGAPLVGPPLPRWAVDLLALSALPEWSAALPVPPGADLPAPADEHTRVTVPGLLALTGFAPPAVADHRVLVPREAAPIALVCPGLDELRALYATWNLGPFGPPPAAVTVEPGGRGLVLHRHGGVVGHPTPWAAADDPFHLVQPALEILGRATATPARGAVVSHDLGFMDRDPLAGPLIDALDQGRWLSDRSPAALSPWVGVRADMAGAYPVWLAGRVQAVVDARGRLVGIDLGATSAAMINREMVRRYLLRAVAGVPIGRALPPLWLPSPGGDPEAATGLAPGPGSIWVDADGTLGAP